MNPLKPTKAWLTVAFVSLLLAVGVPGLVLVKIRARPTNGMEDLGVGLLAEGIVVGVFFGIISFVCVLMAVVRPASRKDVNRNRT